MPMASHAGPHTAAAVESLKSSRWDTRRQHEETPAEWREPTQQPNNPHYLAIEVSSAVKPAALAADEPPPLPAAPCRRPSIRVPRVRLQVIPPLAPLLF